MSILRVILKPGKEKPVLGRHPWVFSGAIQGADEDLKAGNLVRVESAAGQFLGTGYANPQSQIALRMLTFREEPIDLAFFVRRLSDAKILRERLMPPHTNAFRCVHSEGDFLPGLVIDRYGGHLVVQFLTAGMEMLKPLIIRAMEEVFHPIGIYERGDSDARHLEGLGTRDQDLSGTPIPDQIEIEECGHPFVVDVKRGQKTGFFLDQRDNRKMVEGLAQGRKVLNCFAYSGGFSVYAAKGGAVAVTSVEIQKKAVDLLRRNFELNGLNGKPHEVVCEDVFDFLRRDGHEYDLVILDPPAFCHHKSEIMKASRGYKDINLYAMKRLAPGGFLFSASCSSFIAPELFQKIIFAAAKDAGREVQIIKKTSHPFDHPINIYHPEGEYLKGLLLRVL